MLGNIAEKVVFLPNHKGMAVLTTLKKNEKRGNLSDGLDSVLELLFGITCGAGATSGDITPAAIIPCPC